MTENQIHICLNKKHQSTITKFKQEVTELEGQYVGYLGDYVADALDFYIHYMKHFPEKIGKEKHTFSNLSKTQQKTNKFVEYSGESLKPIKDQGMDEIAFDSILKTCFKKGERTLKSYKKEILSNARWSIINIPQCNKRIILHRSSNIYPLVERFDVTLNNYHKSLRPNKEEKVIFSQLREKLLPNKKEVSSTHHQEKEVDDFFSGLEAEEE